MRPRFADRGLAAAFWLCIAVAALAAAYGCVVASLGEYGHVLFVTPVAFLAFAAMMYALDRHERHCPRCQENARALDAADRSCHACGQPMPDDE